MISRPQALDIESGVTDQNEVAGLFEREWQRGRLLITRWFWIWRSHGYVFGRLELRWIGDPGFLRVTRFLIWLDRRFGRRGGENCRQKFSQLRLELLRFFGC